MTEKSEFTFFPNPEEQEKLGQATVKELISIFERQPQMAGRFIHELLRQEREQDLYEALVTLRGVFIIFEAASSDVVRSVAMMIGMHEVDKEEGMQFVDQVVELFMKLVSGVAFNEDLDTAEAKAAEEIAADLRQSVRSILDTYNKSMN